MSDPVIVHWTSAAPGFACGRCGTAMPTITVAQLTRVRRPSEGLWWTEVGQLLPNGHLGKGMALCPLSDAVAAGMRQSMAKVRTQRKLQKGSK